MALGTAALGWSTAARADTVDGTRSESVVEERHQIQLEMSRDHATLRVERRLYNGS